MIGPFPSYLISGKPQNADYLYKNALSLRLLRFHHPGDVVYAQTMEYFFITVLKSPRSHDFLKQIEPDVPRRPQTSAGKSFNHRSKKRLKTWLRSIMTKERF